MTLAELLALLNGNAQAAPPQQPSLRDIINGAMVPNPNQRPPMPPPTMGGVRG